ncbi:MAG: MFS transporter [Bacteroidota bacterium]|nr:MFS transporter [Bacteroidota bacterium]MDP4234270.1 MFS transporter [Bacteroidota bacterium]MDP4243460.1 MFS transporter [Bacteroidota bacterium]MDP4289162.1 MFS transporter [Bacteroidota bacterium]
MTEKILPQWMTHTPPQLHSRVGYDKKVIGSWAMFDFAMGSFSTTMVVFIFPIYFHDVIVQNGHGDAYWGLTVFGSMLLVALITPLLGAMADVLHNKKLYLGIFAATVVTCTASLYFVQPGMVLVAALLFLFANAGYEGGLVFYDAFLPEITTPASFGRVSGMGFAFGYVGSLAILLMSIPFLDDASRKTTFLITAADYALCAIPLFLFVPEIRRKESIRFGTLVQRGFGQLRTTIGHIRNYKDVSRFLAAFFIYNDGILTVVAFSGIYSKGTLHFGTIDLAIFFIMIQVVAILGSLLFGKFADARGPKLAIQITLLMWIVVAVFAFFATTKTTFYGVGFLAGLALGSCQACSRSLMALLTPPQHTAEFFGFYDGFAGKASGIIGPLVFGVLSELFGSQRPAILAIAAFFIAGFFLLSSVREQRADGELGQIKFETT